jgi:hypothetical protein
MTEFVRRLFRSTGAALAAGLVWSAAGADPGESAPAPGKTGPGVLELGWGTHPEGLDERWREQRLWGRTDYRLERVGEVPVLRAEASSAGSALYRRFEPRPVSGLRLCWSWEAVLFPEGESMRTKGGDDRAAAVAVVFEESWLPWRTKAIFYVWSRDLPVGSRFPNPFAGGVRVLVLRSGDAGGWESEERDLAADYRLCFGEDPGTVEAVGVLTDADNTGSRAAARYGPISLLRAAPPGGGPGG